MIISFLHTLKEKNKPLYWFGMYNFAMGLICLALMQIDHRVLLGVDEWLKPFKFYLAVGIMVWTMGWILPYLGNVTLVKRFNTWIIITMLFENALIFLQAARGTTSHYNASSIFNNIVFSMMGIFILIFTITCILICFLFFRKKNIVLSPSYLWGIRLGLLFFILSSLEGGLMLARMQHTVGGPDGGPGLPVTNWSNMHGDLRIAHFFGIHSLQILPLAGFYIIKKKGAMISFAILYAAIVIVFAVLALKGIPPIK